MREVKESEMEMIDERNILQLYLFYGNFLQVRFYFCILLISESVWET